jgi:hypothetical protein
MNEHRRSPRKTAYMTIPVSNAMTGDMMGRIGNLSNDGMLLVCNRLVPDDSLFQLGFELVDGDGNPRSLEVGVHEQWSEPANVPGQFWVGFRFIDISPHDQATIESWLGDNAD